MKLFLLLSIASAVLASSDCGVRLIDNNGAAEHRGRVIGANEVTTSGKWPWQVLIRMKFSDGSVHTCGGTVLSERWILTAGHCVKDEHEVISEDLVVMAEVTNSSENSMHSSLLNKHTNRVLNAIPHQNFSRKTLEDDIALLELENTLRLDPLVSPICLPSIHQDVPDDGQAVITGFGMSNVRGTDQPVLDRHLRETIVPIVREEVCENRWKNHTNTVPSSAWKKYRIICAGSMGHDAGRGDSGGPLMMKASDGRWFQIGITSFGDSGIEGDRFPGAYTDVREYCEWIEKTTKEVKCQEKEVALQDVVIKR